jgi:ABC-type sugar transport system ATPase subunit
LVRLENVTKTFSGVPAVQGATVTFSEGEVHALVGENGAGKSTLMKVLCGIYPYGTYTGRIVLGEQEQRLHSPKAAVKAGISMIHQELSPFPDLTVAENLFVGIWPTSGWGTIEWDRLNSLATTWLSRVGAKLEPETPMRQLSVGNQQLVEIAKALLRNSQVLVLDEPTSALSDAETDHLFKLIENLVEDKKIVIYISHKMEEIFKICHRITVLRDGKVIGTQTTNETTEKEVIDHMVGRALNQLFPIAEKKKIGEIILQLQEVSGTDATGKKLFGPISLDLKSGEILGLAGLLGAGRTELMKALVGSSEIEFRGKVTVLGQEYHPETPRKALRKHLVYVSEDRKRESLFYGRSLESNFSISRLAEGTTRAHLQPSHEEVRAEKRLKDFNTRYSNIQQEIQELSGGNQQKVVIARALEVAPGIIFLDEPTRGVDVGAKSEIYKILHALAEDGKGVVVASSELPELIGVCDRIIVMHEGAQKGELQRSEFSQEAIMNLALATERRSEA